MTDTTDQHEGSNWGRWGADDERGTLNLLTPERVLAATQVCKTGKVYSLALPIQKQGRADPRPPRRAAAPHAHQRERQGAVRCVWAARRGSAPTKTCS